MTLIRDELLDSTSHSFRHVIVVPLITAVAQADKAAWSWKPGYAFEIEDVQVYCLSTTVTVSADVKIGTVSALSAAKAFVAATLAAATLNATESKRYGDSDDAINVHYTSDADGALVNGFVTLVIRPRIQRGDPDAA